MTSIELHIFTNATQYAPSVDIITETYNSFINKFNYDGKVTVWYDPKPNIEHAEKYLHNLKEIFHTVNITTSLSDGYVRAVKSSTSDFLFMLEHDWKFLPTLTHSLTEICNVIQEENLIHLRFNKRSNESMFLDKRLEERSANINYCVTPFLSNNPHIIKRDIYIHNALQYVQIEEGSLGIEQRLKRVKSLTGAIYGPLGYPQTVEHLDGRGPEDIIND